MVPLDQEDQSQEEDDVPVLEGFQWDSLLDSSASGASRKRSLSESSVAPASSMFTSLMSNESAQEMKESSVSSTPIYAQGNKDNQHQQEVEQMLGQFEAKAQKQPDKLTSASVKALQRSDSVLGDSSSGTELCDGQGTGKRRRAAGVSNGNSVKEDSFQFTHLSVFIGLEEYYDCKCEKWLLLFRSSMTNHIYLCHKHKLFKVECDSFLSPLQDVHSAETSCLEHNNKRRKVKSKKGQCPCVLFTVFSIFLTKQQID